VHYWADLQSVHGLRCYGNIMPTRNVSEYVVVLALCLVVDSVAQQAVQQNPHNESSINRKLYSKSATFHKILQLVNCTTDSQEIHN